MRAARIPRLLRRGGWRVSYQKIVSDVLDWSDRLFLEPERRAVPDYRSWRRAWSVRLYDRCLLLAVLYPLLFALVQWGVTDEDALLGSQVFIGGSPERSFRVATIGGLGSVLFCGFLAAMCSRSFPRLLWSASAITASFIGTVSVAYSTQGQFVFIFAVPGQVDVGGAIAFSFAVASLTVLAVVHGSSQIGAIVIAGVCATSLVGAVGLLDERMLPLAINRFFKLDARLIPIHEFHASFAAAINIFSIIAAFFTIGIVHLVMRLKFPRGFFLAALPMAGGAVAFLVTAKGDTIFPSYFLFFMVLPVVNAMFDFGSIGLTRWAMRRGVARVGPGTVLWSGADLLAAALLFLALGCAGIGVAHALNLANAAGEISTLRYGYEKQVLPLHGSENLFDAIWADPLGHWWVYATFFSTLLPTLLHLMLASLALGPALLTRRWRERVARWLEVPFRTDPHKYLAGIGIAAAWCAVALAGPVILLVGLGNWIFVEHCSAGLWLLDFFEGFYRLISGEGEPSTRVCGGFAEPVPSSEDTR